MEQIPKGGGCYANKFTRIDFETYEDLMGNNGLNAMGRDQRLSSLKTALRKKL